MASVNIGELIQTATKNIHYDRQPTEEELSLAQELAPYIRESEGNWIPVFVKELGIHNYQLVGNPIILEANKIAEQKITYCIPIGDNKEVETQIQKGQNLVSQYNTNHSSNNDNLIPLMNRVEKIEEQLKQQTEKVNQIFQQVVPDQKLAINEESEEYLKLKLSYVPGIGEKTLPKIVEDIINRRPFSGKLEMMSKVRYLKPPKTKSKTTVPKNERLWQAITDLYEVKFN